MMLRPTPAARASPATVGAVDALLARTLRASRRRASVFARRRACGVDRSVSDAIGISFVELGQDAERFLDACFGKRAALGIEVIALGQRGVTFKARLPDRHMPLRHCERSDERRGG